MVLLAAALCTKDGKPLVSRQFVEMTRSRVEGLLAAFPKLMGSSKQHTFVETESVRYVYQPLERLYMLLITTKASNILEDLETLRLFSRVVPECCRSLDENDVQEHCFELIFAFDEIVALGYRENVNLAQIRTFTEMDSHDEKVALAMRQSQEKEAAAEAKAKARELALARKEAAKHGRTGFAGGIAGGGASSHDYRSTHIEMSHEPPKTSSYGSSKPSSSGRATGMKLGGKNKDVDSFVDKIRAEGKDVPSSTARTTKTTMATPSSPQQQQQQSVHLTVNEKLVVTAGRDGGLQNMEVLGMMQLRVTDPQCGCILIAIDNQDDRPIQFQTHPNVDKKLFTNESVIGLKQANRSFPINSDIGVLKWRLQTVDEALLPLSINCWPQEAAGGSCDVNIEYELLQTYLELQDVTISIPLPSGVGDPVVKELDGTFHHDRRKHVLEWKLPVIDQSTGTGSLEFNMQGGVSDDFFPVRVSFTSPKLYCRIMVGGVQLVEGGSQDHSSNYSLNTDRFEIV
ncbi:coatomer subunit delta-like [Dysidea avara]|uniref:coatomer subunit delta-like n=1 Tax=Dysidea avara TaxID=196820 RepID=UPI003319B258